MLRVTPILGAAVVTAVATLSACGQRGPLYLPTESAAQGRATLPQSLRPSAPDTTAVAQPASSPVSSPTTTSTP